MYWGNGGDRFIEFTNVGVDPVDITGWSFDNHTALPGSVDLSAFGVVQPSESVVLSYLPPATFVSNWSLSNVDVVDGLIVLNRDDQLNLFDNHGDLVDRLTYSAFGSKRAAWVSFAGLGQDDITEWTLSSLGDLQGSFASVNGSIGSPGSHVIPEPTSLGILGFGSVAFLRRTRKWW